MDVLIMLRTLRVFAHRIYELGNIYMTDSSGFQKVELGNNYTLDTTNNPMISL